MHTWQEAITRMSRRGSKSVRWTLADRVIEYKYIPATSARNYDGSSAGAGQDPNTTILQQMVWRDGGQPRFSNQW